MNEPMSDTTITPNRRYCDNMGRPLAHGAVCFRVPVFLNPECTTPHDWLVTLNSRGECRVFPLDAPASSAATADGEIMFPPHLQCRSLVPQRRLPQALPHAKLWGAGDDIDVPL